MPPAIKAKATKTTLKLYPNCPIIRRRILYKGEAFSELEVDERLYIAALHLNNDIHNQR